MSKHERFKLENEIINIIYENNKNTPHFNYRVNIDEDECVKLELFTFNKRNEEVFLLSETIGKNAQDCLEKMIAIIKKMHTYPHPFVVEWENLISGKKDVSYFWEVSEEKVRSKFFYNRKEEDYKIKIKAGAIS